MRRWLAVGACLVILGGLALLLGPVILHAMEFARDGQRADSSDGAPRKNLTRSNSSGRDEAGASPGHSAPSVESVLDTVVLDTADAPGTVSLVGFVTDVRGQPLEGVRVSAEPIYRSSAKTKGEGETDAQGHFRIRALEPGLYEVTFQKKRFLAHELKAHPLSSHSEPVEVALQPAQLIEGLVVDAMGQPIPGAELWLQDVESEEREPSAPRDEESGPEGTFILDTPQAAPWSLLVRHARFVDSILEVTSPARGVRIVMHPGASVEVSVLDAQGQPIPRAEVMVWTYNNYAEWSSIRQAERQRQIEKVTQADESGRAEFGGLEPGTYTLAAMLPPEDGLGLVMQRLELRGQETRRAVLRFEEEQNISGVVVDPSGRPIPDMEVRFFPGDQGRMGVAPRGELLGEHVLSRMREGFFEPRRTVRTGLDGRFTVPYLAPVTWQLFFLREGYALVEDPGYEVEEDDGLTWVRVPAGMRGLRVVLTYQGRVHGRVVRSDGEPLTSFKINYFPQTSPDGTFTWPAGAPGRHTLLIVVPGVAGVEREYEAKLGEDVELGDVVLGTGRPVQVRVVDAESSEPVSGVLLILEDAERGEELRPGELGLDIHEPVVTGEDGTCLLPDVPARPLSLEVRHEDYVKQRVSLDAETREVTLRLSAGAILEGWVRINGAPMHAGRVVLYTLQREKVASTRVDEGWYTEHALPPGRYIARVDCHGSDCPEPEPVFLPRWIEVPAQGTRSIDFDDTRSGATLEVHAFERLEWLELVAGLWSPPSGSEPRRVARVLGHPREELEEGKGYRFRNVPAGAYTLIGEYERADGSEVLLRQEVQAPAGGIVPLTLTPSP